MIWWVGFDTVSSWESFRGTDNASKLEIGFGSEGIIIQSYGYTRLNMPRHFWILWLQLRKMLEALPALDEFVWLANGA